MGIACARQLLHIGLDLQSIVRKCIPTPFQSLCVAHRIKGQRSPAIGSSHPCIAMAADPRTPASPEFLEELVLLFMAMLAAVRHVNEQDRSWGFDRQPSYGFDRHGPLVSESAMNRYTDILRSRSPYGPHFRQHGLWVQRVVAASLQEALSRLGQQPTSLQAALIQMFAWMSRTAALIAVVEDGDIDIDHTAQGIEAAQGIDEDWQEDDDDDYDEDEDGIEAGQGIDEDGQQDDIE